MIALVPGVFLRDARLDDARALAPRLRRSDLDEIAALASVAPVVALERSIARSDPAFALQIGGEVAALFGVVPPRGLERAASVWAMGSDALPKHRKTCIIVAKQFLSMVGEKYGRMANVVDAENAPSLRLLRHLGFTVSPDPMPTPAGGRALAFWRQD